MHVNGIYTIINIYSALLQTEEGLSCNTEKDKGKKLNYHTAGISCSSCIIIIVIYRIAQNFKGTYISWNWAFSLHNVRGMTAYRKPRL